MKITASASTQTLAAYIRAFLDYAGSRAVWAVVLLLMVSLTEGIGLLMLVPFLHLMGFTGQTSTSTPTVITEATGHFLGLFGLPLSLVSVLVLYVLLISFRAVLLGWREIVLSSLKLGFVDHLREQLYQSIAHANWVFLSGKRSSDISHVLTADIARVEQGTYFILQMLVGSFVILVHIVIAFQLSAMMTVVALVAGGLLLLILWPQVSKAKKMGSRLSEANREVYATMTEFLDGIKLAKSYSQEEQYCRSYEKSLKTLRSQILAFIRSNTFVQVIYQMGAAIVLSVLLYIAAVMFTIPGAELLVLVLIFARLLPQLSSMQRSYQYIIHMLPAYASAMDIQNECHAAREAVNNHAEWQPALRQTIQLNNVSFAYDEGKNKNQALDNICLEIKARQTIGITGPSGVGKSTLADILAGLIIPDSGSILIDGHLLSPQDYSLWRRAVAYVPQETFLFHDSIRNNLLWANQHADENDLKRVLKLAAADEFVMHLPDGINTIVGDRGIRLSGGERQRIALARALLSNPSLLILDEATSALDNHNEKRIQQALQNLHGELTIIIIAHRHTTIRHADNIIRIEPPNKNALC